MKDILLLHGALGCSETLDRLASELKGYNVHMLDFPGHGKDQSGQKFSIEDCVTAIEAYISEKKLNSYSIFGYSMGGFAALKFAASQPAGLTGIVTLGTKFDWTPESAAQEIKKLDPEVIREKVPAFADSLERLHGKNWPVLMTHTAAMMTGLGAMNGLSPLLLSSVKIPVLLLLGSKDRMVTPEETEKTASLLPDASFKILEETPHPIEQVNVEMLAGEIGGFL